MVNLLGFMTPKNAELVDPDLEYVWLGDVDTGHYASVLGAPGYQGTAKAHALGEKMKTLPSQHPEGFINEFMPNGRSIASLIKTGFLSAQDYVVLDNSTPTLKEAKAAGGEQGLTTMLTVATPRKDKIKSQLSGNYDEAHDMPARTRFKVAKLHDFQPGVQTYIWALDEAARKRQRSRMRRRAIARRRQQELSYDAYLRRGGEPFRGPRTDAETHQVVEEPTPISGKAYIEQDHVCTYWYDPTLDRWTRMLGVDTSYDNKRKALLATRGRTHEVEDNFDFHSRHRQQYSYEGAIDEAGGVDEMFRCIDKQGKKSLRLHQQWFEHKYALPTNKGECEGLCSFSDGWIFPEGIDGLPTDIDLAFDKHGESLPTHVTCAACNTRLCRKCYLTMLQYHASNGPNLTQFVNTYFLYRTTSGADPMDYPTYGSFLNTFTMENPHILEYDAEDPDLSGEYNKYKDQKPPQWVARQLKLQQKKVESQKQSGKQTEQSLQKKTLEKGHKQLEKKSKKRLREDTLQDLQEQLDKEEKKERKRVEKEQLQQRQLPSKPRQLHKGPIPHNVASSSITTPPSSPEAELAELAAPIDQYRASHKARALDTAPQRAPRGGVQQTNPSRLAPQTQKQLARTMPLPSDIMDLDSQLRGRAIRG